MEQAPASDDAQPVIASPRLILEPLTTAHAPRVYPLLLDPALFTYIPTEPPESETALARRFAVLESRRSPDGAEQWLNWAAAMRDETQYIGLFEATIMPDRAAHIAYTVFVPHQRCGFAREGVEAMMAVLTQRYRVIDIVADIDTRNAASVRLVEAMGFEQVAYTENVDYFKGGPSHEYRYRLRRI